MKALLLVALVLGKTNFCMVCHSEIRKDYRESIHYQENISCMECHGGDGSAREMKKAHGKGFKGIPERRDILPICTRCHSSPEKMRPYGLPFDQEMLYYTSIHGQKLRQGNKDVAVCTDCHGVHRILSGKDPESLVNYRNIHKTCGKCHSDSNLMKRYIVSSDVVAEYLGSIHAEKLLKEGNQRSPTCPTCHGSHGAIPHGIGHIEKVCGQCHRRTREYFLRSPHSVAWKEKGILECEGCHSNHRVTRTSHLLWRKKCMECHEKESKQYKTAWEFYALFSEAKEKIEDARGMIEELEKLGIDVEDFYGRLEEAQTYLVEAEPVSHSLSIDETKWIITKAVSITEEIQRESLKKLNIFRTRRLFLPLIWFFILLTIVIIYQMRNIIAKKYEKS